MTQAAARQWLSDLLSTAGGLETVTVHGSMFKASSADDMLLFLSFASEDTQLTFGDTGSLYQAVYHPELLLLILDPSVEDAQHVLDQYVQATKRALQRVHGPIDIADPDTQETSQIMLVEKRIGVRAASAEDIGPAVGEEGVALAKVVLTPGFVELYTQA